MGTLKVIQSRGLSRDGANTVAVHEFDPANGIDISDLSTSTSSANLKLDSATAYVTIQGDEDMYIQIGNGSSTAATTTDWLLSAGKDLSFKVKPGPDTYLAAEDVS